MGRLGPPSGAPYPYPYPYRKAEETHELIFAWLSGLAVLLECANDDDRVAQDGGHTAANRLTETYSLGL